MDNQTQEKKFVCKSCNSESSGTSGTCCGAERDEKKEVKACQMCGHEHKADGTCDCGCK